MKHIFYILTICVLPFLFGCNTESDYNSSLVTGNKLSESKVVYEANLKLYAETNAINAIKARLDNIKSLGVDILWLMPVYEEGNYESVGSPYCIKDYTKLNPEYGSIDDLKSLVSLAHEKGMKVILDWVANHTSWDNIWISNKNWYTQDANGNIISPQGTEWNDVADLNYDNFEMRQAMIDAMKYWISETDVDGYRCDYAEGVPEDFWRAVISELRNIKGNDLIMLAEGSSDSFYEYGFNGVYGWNFTLTLQEVFKGNKLVTDLYKVYNDEIKNVPQGCFRLRYSTNHDLASEDSPINVYGGDKGAMAAFVIATMLEGYPLIYSSQEIGYDQSLSFFEYNIMDWNSNQNYMSDYISYMEIYKNTAEFRGGKLKLYNTGEVVSLYYSNGLLVMVNTTDEEQTVKTPIERSGEMVKNVETNEELVLPISMKFQPYEYKIFSNQ